MKPQRKTSQVVTFPAPIGGWNNFDPLPEMQPTDAVVLDNFFCLPSQVQIRKGYSPWVTGLAGKVQSLFNYAPQSGTEKIYAATNNAGVCQIVDVTTSGTGGTTVVAAQNSAYYKTALFSNAAGAWLYCVNGVDAPQRFDGTTWLGITTGAGANQIAGVATTTFSDVISHKNRLWFVQKNTMSCWYLGVSNVAGTAVEFPMGALFKHGGAILKIDTWTLDAGYGLDDYLCIFTTKGEVAVYRGTDPSQASTWALTGVFYIGSPTDTGHSLKYGGDLLLINKDGLAQMSKSLMSSRVSTLLTLTQKIQPQLADDTSTYQAIAGWDLVLYPPENMLIVNVPISTTQAYQYVMNTISGAWSRWTNIPAQCWCFTKELLFFGSTGAVYKMWDTQADNGAAINATMVPAFQKFGAEGQVKRFNLARVIYSYSSSISVGMGILTDFNPQIAQLLLPATVSSNLLTWGVSTWGNAVWGGQLTTDRNWKTVSGFGYWGSLQVQFQTKVADVRVYSLDYNIELGNVL